MRRGKNYDCRIRERGSGHTFQLNIPDADHIRLSRNADGSWSAVALERSVWSLFSADVDNIWVDISDESHTDNPAE